MQETPKRFWTSAVLDIALLLAALRAADFPEYRNRVLDSAEGRRDDLDGSLVGLLHSSQFQNSWGAMSGYSLKSHNHHYDNIMDQYESIMRDLHSRPPVLYLSHVRGEPRSTPSVRNEITMVISIRNPNMGGEVQVASNHFAGGAVGGGLNTGWFEDNLDIFNNFLPSNMGEEEINNLILSSTQENTTITNSQSDTRWQQFLSGYESLDAFQTKRVDPINWGGQDVLAEAILSSELFSNPVLNSPEVPQSMDVEESSPQDDNLLSESRLELIDNQEWSSQNHEEDLLFPSLPPSSYDEAVNSSSTEENPDLPPSNLHMHDHNYFNSSGPSNSAAPTVVHEEPVGYAIRSRHEVSTRVISIPPRRPVQASSPSEVFETASNTSSETSGPASRESVRRITTGSDSGVEGDFDAQVEDLTSLLPSTSSQYNLNELQILPLNSTYYQNLSKVVGHSEVIVCN